MYSFLGDRLLDIPCKVCGDRSSGKHYGIYSCDGKLLFQKEINVTLMVNFFALLRLLWLLQKKYSPKPGLYL